MKVIYFIVLFFFSSTIFFPESSMGQYYKTSKGSIFARKGNVHSGNQIRTSFFNYGFIGRRNNQPNDYGGEWPINSGHFYVGDISVMVGAEVTLPNGQKITPVTVADGPRGNNEYNPNDPTDFWGWEPLSGFDNPDTTIVAMSHRLQSWPASWPDRRNDISDPGWPGQWNGYFGKDQFNADQESYWVMDDSRDKEFVNGYNFYPDSTDLDRGGLALLANVRGLQWSQTLAQNTIFWLYDVKNVGTTDYDKVVFGMIVGTTIGGDGDTNDDNSEFDALEDLTYSWDFDNIGNTGWTPVGYMGYAFLESPGNRLNGFDDDNDGVNFAIAAPHFISDSLLLPTVVAAGDQVITIDYSDPSFPRHVINLPANGLTYIAHGKTYQVNPGDTLFEEPFNNVDDNLNGLIDENTEIVGDNIDNNKNGLIDEPNPQIGLAYFDYRSGDTLNPMIDEGRDDGIDNDGDWNVLTNDDVGLDGKPSTGDFGENDGLPTSGYQPDPITGLLVDTGLPGEPNIDKTDIDESDQVGLTSFYFFAPFNVVKLNNDAQLWSTLRPGYYNVGQLNKDGDFIYGTGYFPLRVDQTERISLAFFFGNNLADIYRTKKTVQLIYDNNYNFAKAPQLPTLKAFAGDKKVTLYWDSKAEDSFDQISLVQTGNGFDFEGYKIYRSTYPTWEETGVVTNVFGSRVADVPMAQYDLVNADSGFFPILDPQSGATFYLGDNTGLVHTFTDTTVNNGFKYFYAVTAYDHGISTGEVLQPAETSKYAAITSSGKIELGQNVVVVRPEAPAAGYVAPGQAMETLEHVSGDGSGRILVEVIDPSVIMDNHEYEITFQDTNFFRETKNFSVKDLTTGLTVVHQNPKLDVDATIVDGVKIHIMNDRSTSTDKQNVKWADTTRNIILPRSGSGWSRFSFGLAQGKAYPANYQLEVGELGVDSSAGLYVYGLPAAKFPVNFRIKNISENRYIKFNLYDIGGGTPGVLDQQDLIAMFEFDTSAAKLTYQIVMGDDSTAETPSAGDILYLPVKKPFLDYDVFQYEITGPQEDRQLAKSQLDKIGVVPNPYIAVAAWEPKNNYSSGRGERAIHFIGLPQKCTIRIYTIRGELVNTIEHNSPVTNGTADWNLLTQDQLDVAYGVYIFHVDAPGVGEKIGKFAIIK